MYNDQFGEFVALNITIIFYLNPFERTPRMGPESRSCTFSLGRPVSRKAGNKKKKELLCSFNIQKFHFISFIRQWLAYANEAKNVNKDSPI